MSLASSVKKALGIKTPSKMDDIHSLMKRYGLQMRQERLTQKQTIAYCLMDKPHYPFVTVWFEHEEWGRLEIDTADGPEVLLTQLKEWIDEHDAPLFSKKGRNKK